ncbi:MAG TPA: CYTH domain-containing protein [Hyphomicrobiaceae bacterium]|jgi:adenylate cyclase|nr:CYTH domain-containing protein [Hyphomicrobiaceae bacterium]
MPFEIERKFLVRGEHWRTLATDRVQIRQAYLATDGKASVRVRINDKGATLTIKSRAAERRRLELEYAIPVIEAEALIALRRGIVVEKERYLVPVAGMVWEVDVFGGENEGLVIAEIELRDEHQRIELPAWVGQEVTGQAQFYNSMLSTAPFANWAHERKFALNADL